MKRSPFDPFRVIMRGGDHLLIVRPDMALVTGRELVIAVPDPTHPEGERAYINVGRIEVLRPSTAA